MILVVDHHDHHVNAVKNSQVVNVKPLLPSNNNSKSSFSQSLPKGVPIPPSAPSKRHNQINIWRPWRNYWRENYWTFPFNICCEDYFEGASNCTWFTSEYTFSYIIWSYIIFVELLITSLKFCKEKLFITHWYFFKLWFFISWFFFVCVKF